MQPRNELERLGGLLPSMGMHGAPCHAYYAKLARHRLQACMLLSETILYYPIRSYCSGYAEDR